LKAKILPACGGHEIQQVAFEPTSPSQKIQDDEGKYFREWQTKHGVTIRYPSPEDRQLILEACKRAQDYIIKKQESEGHTAAHKVWDYYTSALKKYEDQRAKK